MNDQKQFEVDLTLIPPSPVTSKVILDLRTGIFNRTERRQTYRVAFYADFPSTENRLAIADLELGPGEKGAVDHRVPALGFCGEHVMIAQISGEGEERLLVKSLLVIPSEERSSRRIDGAFAGFYHWSEEEGRLWNSELKTMSPEDWRDLVRAQDELGMKIIVPQEMFRNQMYVGQHSMETENYGGNAFYPSRLHPGRVAIKTADPLEEVLSVADELGMQVFLAVGMYAWFDFSQGSLEWHKTVATELWERYGHHPSVYGWYVSEEVFGNLGETSQRREDIVRFFQEFQKHCHSLAPAKPLMLAPNCYGIPESIDHYRRLLKHIDILCPFGYHRMPEGDLSGEEAASLLQRLCDESQTHLWLDMEAFLFEPDGALSPRPIDGLIRDFTRFPNFEKIICYQFPGIFNAPWAKIKPGGQNTVRLFEDYARYLASHEKSCRNKIEKNCSSPGSTGQDPLPPSPQPFTANSEGSKRE